MASALGELSPSDRCYAVNLPGPLTGSAAFADPVTDVGYRLGDERTSTGIALLDRMLADGYAPGSSTLLASPSGIGKTFMGLPVIVNGAASGEPGVIATL